ncbi:MAG: 2-nitropropane dioxygenase-like enzyme [Deltaproteobacteria bacterium]|nr:2-nitropropane dioxygenase-like enzyme [Deltaproteobacteria bacterium]
MRTALCDTLGIEFPIVAFTHCRDVVVAVSKAGGFGVLGVVGTSPEQIEIELAWIDAHIGDHTYGVDVLIPSKYEGMDEMDPVRLEQRLRALVPAQHRAFAEKILADHCVPKLPGGEEVHELIGWTVPTATPQIEAALRHPKVRLIANALGTPPAEVIREIHGSGRLIAALSGSAKHARAHREAGVDIIVANGYEGGGHTGEVGSMVLWPEVIEAVAPTPVLAAGGIATGRQIAAALAMGAEGVWTGSLWLTVQEADVPPAQMALLLAATSRDTVRSRSWTGKPCRLLRSAWTEAWEAPDAPKPLGMPLQGMVVADAIARTRRYPDQATDVMMSPVGQIVGRLNAVRSVKEVMRGLVEEYLEAVERLQRLTSGPSE